MNVLNIIDQDDGSAIVEVEMTEKEKDMFIEIGFLTALKEGMKIHENNISGSIPYGASVSGMVVDRASETISDEGE